MIKVKACAQMKSSLNGRSVMIFKTWPSFQQVPTQNESFADALKLLSLLSMVST